MAAACLLASCSSTPPQTESERRSEQVSVAQQRAAGAVARDDLRAAQGHYQVALDRGRATEDEAAVATGLLNLAAVLHRAGELAAARAKLLELTEHQPPLAPAYVGRAEARLALIELQMKRYEEAERRAQRAAALCPQAACAWRLALDNVQAGIALRRGDLAGAESRARAARAAAAAARDVREEANAWRLLGEIAGENGRSGEAREALQAALELDRRVQAPERIALDLLALSRLELALGNRQLAREYAQRAASVADAARLAAASAASRSLLREAQ